MNQIAHLAKLVNLGKFYKIYELLYPSELNIFANSGNLKVIKSF